MLPIYYVSSPAGSGKTRVASQAAHARAAGGGYALLVVPTLRLSGEVVDRLRGLLPAIMPEVIHSETTSSVTAAIHAALKRKSEGGRIVIITKSAFERLSLFWGKEKWAVYIDEVLQVWSMAEAMVPQTHHHLTEHLELRSKGPVYSEVIVTSAAGINRLADTDDVALSGSLAPFAQMVRSPNVVTYTRSASFEALLAGKKRKLKFQFLLRPQMLSGFERVTIFAANFEHSLSYKLWSTESVFFAEDQELLNKIRSQEHQNGHLVRIYYAVKAPWSKRLRDRNDCEIFKAFARASAELMAEEPFLWAANKDVPDTLFEDSFATRLPHVSHGLNSYDHIHNVVYLSARLPPPEQFAFLAWRGVSDTDVRRAVHHDAVYQTALRSSIRNPSDESPKRVVVPDLPSAEHLQALLPGSSIEKIDIGLSNQTNSRRPGRSRKFDDTAARVRAHRAQRKAQSARLAAIMMDEFGEFTTILSEVASPEGQDDLPKTCNENTYREDRRNIVTQNFHGSLFDHMKATLPCAVVTNISVDDFAAALKRAHKGKQVSKEDNRLISPALFDESLSDNTSRGLANVVCANGIWLDVDAGDMSHKDFAGIFPQLRIVAFNSFSSTRTQPRYRIYIPTSRTMSTSEYASIFDQVVQAVKDEGFPLPKNDEGQPRRKAHGIDMTKRHAASLFYLPCQPKDPKGKIWKDFKSEARRPLDVDDWLAHAIPIEAKEYDVAPVPSQPAEGEVDLARRDRAVQRWEEVGTQKSNGDREMYVLARELERSGVPHFEAEATLLAAAQAATSPADRKRQVQTILRNRRRFWPT